MALQKKYAHAKDYAQNNFNVIENKGIEITASHEISVAGTTLQGFTSDAYLALPYDVLGTEYIVLSHNQGPNAWLQVVATEDNTQVTILPTSALSGGRTANVAFTVTLNKNQAGLWSTSADLSGSTVTSTKPISVFGGHVCANVPTTSTSACDTLVDQMPPLSTLGKTFALVPFFQRNGGDWIRVLATKAGTEIKLNNNTLATINAKQVHSFNLPSTTFALLEASEPVMVIQLLKGSSSDNVQTDPAMAVVPPISQWSNNYIFSTVGPLPSPERHYVSVTAPADQIGGVRLDGLAIPAADWVNVFGSQYKAHRRQLSLGSHTLNHVQPNIGLQVQVYGYGNYDSYAFPGGQRFAALGEFCTPSTAVANDGKDNDCDGRVDEELINGIDDDGDGKIDEDTASTGDVPPCPDTQTVALADLGATQEPIVRGGSGKCFCLEIVQQV